MESIINNKEPNVKWFKHDGHARNDEKIEKLLIKYGVEGYGLYFYCVEIIAGNLSGENITFELKHDSETIANRLKMDTMRVGEIMMWMKNIGLFQYEEISKRMFCFGLLKRLDISTSQNPEIKKIVKKSKESDDYLHLIEANTRLDKIRLDKSKKDIVDETPTLALKKPEKKPKKKEYPPEWLKSYEDKVKYIVSKFKSATGKQMCRDGYDAKWVQHYIVRWLKEGWDAEKLMLILKYHYVLWGKNKKMKKWIRPQTIFGPDSIEWRYEDALQWHEDGEPKDIAQDDGRPEDRYVEEQKKIIANKFIGS